ncbi:hypothetical protein JW935_15230 [candidate division KSB1 bacterium]|nr:hypothetical protein [candidate division KSB1 bacterium]
MKTLVLFFVLYFCCFTPLLHSQSDSTTIPLREYRLLLGDPNESEIFATAGVTLNKAMMDLYLRHIGPHMPSTIAPWVETLWYINWTFIFTMWPHDGGHWARAQQIGGDFVMTGFGYPFPVMEMRLPEDIPKKERTLTSIGGHEINFLMRQKIHTDYYKNQYAFADELVHGFIQDIFYPMYSFLIAYADPTKPSVWTDTRGDPVEYNLSVFENFTGRPAIRDDGTVDPELVDQYNESVLLGLVWPMLNPMFYRSLKAFNADLHQNRGLMKPPWMLGKNKLSWAWGTHFNPSPLGYELYCTNYFRYMDRLYLLTLKTGRPHKNNGIGIGIPRLFRKGNFCIGLTANIWDQAIFGRGGSVELEARYAPNRGLGLIVKGGWKTQGYQVGRRVGESALLLAGFSYSY